MRLLLIKEGRLLFGEFALSKTHIVKVITENIFKKFFNEHASRITFFLNPGFQVKK